MGRQNDVLLDYFDDNERFADLCNATLFGGLPVIDPAKLEDASARYTQRGRDSRGDITYSSSYRDLKKRLKDAMSSNPSILLISLALLSVYSNSRLASASIRECMTCSGVGSLYWAKRLESVLGDRHRRWA